LEITHSGAQLYATDHPNGAVAIISTESNEVIGRVPIDGALRQIAVSPEDDWVFVSVFDERSIAVIGRAFDESSPCEYVDTPGTAEIVSLNRPSQSEHSCAIDPVAVVFNFVPDDPAAVAQYGVAWWPDTGQLLTLADGANPPTQWVIDEGLLPGTAHRCARREIKGGACVPVLFEFSDIDYAKGVEMCWSDNDDRARSFASGLFCPVLSATLVGATLAGAVAGKRRHRSSGLASRNREE
jgi:hypothetical protein